VVRLSILIVHWNTASDLRTCLQALAQFPLSSGSGETEIIVIDNASIDNAVAMVRSEFPTVRLIENATNECYARATNQGLEAARGELFLLLNPDARVTENALNILVAFLESHADAAIIAPKLIWPDGRVQHSVRIFPTPLSVLSGRYFRSVFDYETVSLAPQPMASCLLLRKSVHEKISGMDEDFPLYFNDVDWNLRAEQAGLKTYYTPEAVVIHDHGGTTKRVKTSALWESRRSWLRFNKKHFSRDPLRVFVNLLIVLDAWRRTGRWGVSLGKDGGETTPESLRRELERKE
jgi:GT2 family glycosyltransferase